MVMTLMASPYLEPPIVGHIVINCPSRSNQLKAGSVFHIVVLSKFERVAERIACNQSSHT